MILVLRKQNINLGMWHTAIPSSTKQNRHFNHSALFILVKKYFLIVAAYFGAYTKAIIRLNLSKIKMHKRVSTSYNPYPTAFPYGNAMVLHFYQQQESSTTKTVHKVINKGLKTYV